MSARDHWEDLADHLGSAYLRYSFTKGTEQEVAFLVEELGLEPGMRVLDVGCGPGRHAHALGRRGIEVHGIDISQRFVDLARIDAPAGVTFERADARGLAYDGEFDAAVSLCQGAFGVNGDRHSGSDRSDADGRVDVGVDVDAVIFERLAASIRVGGRLALSAFSAYFQVRHLEVMGSTFDAALGVNHERTTIKDEAGIDAEVDLWTTCFTPRELRHLAGASGLEPLAVWSVSPGAYARQVPTVASEEFLLIARRPPVPTPAADPSGPLGGDGTVGYR